MARRLHRRSCAVPRSPMWSVVPGWVWSTFSEVDTEVSTRIMEGIIETIGEYEAVDVGVFDIVEAEPTR